MFSSAVAGMLLARRLPEHHLSTASRDSIKLSIGLIATLSALVMGMLISLASGVYQNQRREVQRLAADVLMLDRVLALYGPEAADARAQLRRSAGTVIEEIWPTAGKPPAQRDPLAHQSAMHDFWNSVIGLQPRNDEQRTLKNRAVDLATGLGQLRFELFSQTGSGVPSAFLAVLIAWMGLIAAGFGFLSPLNPSVVTAFLATSLCVAGAFFLLIELTQPFDGVMQISGDPVRASVALLGR